MELQTETLARGDGWLVQDVVCGAGPRDRPYEERHGGFSIALVLEGTFRYRTEAGSALLVPGAVMLGNAGQCFECGHEHGVGDRCLSFHFAPDYWEAVVAALPGVRSARFDLPRLPPLASLERLTLALESALPTRATPTLESVALELAARVTAALRGADAESARFSSRDAGRVTEIVRHIEANAHVLIDGELSVATLAARAGMSPYHFLRTFRALAGVPPHQFVLRTRLARAAVRLKVSREPVSEIAFAAGFNDLSSFNRRFRRIMGCTPIDYRGKA